MLTSSQPPTTVIPQPATIQDAKAGGAVAGTMLSAPLAPSTGPIDTPIQPVARKGDEPGREPMVVVAVKSLWQSATVKALRAAVMTACGLAVLIVAAQIISANGDIWAINWQTTQKAAIGAGMFSLASAFAGWWKVHDNNAIAKGLGS